ncbi:hypothetical protein [Lutispora thermophila]|uniref:Uncharacterized protein n=1 Tax=Lutispora thermophila DSM 19022 TaxID=1122184 RepID=A0A1M6I7S6_9FIRM|nr:hypothetical protein [Lutispora thermophila]SHJ30482.1 hypothetical protein SAMN02745176_03115 [Lutispora thermophila DSM 19022]
MPNYEKNNESVIFSLEDFTPEIYDCEADGSCSNGHIHVIAES